LTENSGQAKIKIINIIYMNTRNIVYLVIVVAIVVFLLVTQGNQAPKEDTSGSPNTTMENITVENMKDNVNSQIADLEAVDGSNSFGTGFRFVKDGTLLHSVTATMPDPAEGNSYEGWLVQTEPLKFFSTGIMNKMEDGTWGLEYTADQEYPTYQLVVVTEETIVDDTPETHIIEGSFSN
jgi:hypothetical protein